jgi:PEP-CTERM motif-containing protein
VVTGTGFNTLRFRVTREGLLVVDQTFATVASAMSFFHDKVLQVSDWTTGVSPDNILDLEFTLDVVGSQAGSAFSTDFLVGNATIAAIPEPSTYVLFAFGLVGLLAVARRRRAGLRDNV